MLGVKLKKISEIQTAETAVIKNIFQKANWLKSLQENIAAFLPQELTAHCRVANFEKGILVFAIENAAWAMKFRFITTDLLKRLRTEANLPQVTAVKYYIEPEFLNLFKGERIMDKRSSKGFTTLELVVAIVLIVGLAGGIIPRFMAQASYARTVAVSAMSSAVRSAVALAVVQHKTGGQKSEIKIGSKMVKISSSGYPLGTQEGIGSALKNVDGFVPTFGSTTFYNLVPSRNNCSVSYDSTTGIVSPVTSGC